HLQLIVQLIHFNYHHNKLKYYFIVMDASNIDRVDHWRKKAFDFSSSDRMGFVLSRAMDLMAIVVKDGTRTKNLQFAARSLDMELRLTMEEDDERSSPLREMVYGLCETLGITIKSILDERTHEEHEISISQEMINEEVKEEPLYTGMKIPKETKEEEFVPPLPLPSFVLPKEESMEEQPFVLPSGTKMDSMILPQPAPPSNSLAAIAMRFFGDSAPSTSFLHSQKESSNGIEMRGEEEKRKDHECDHCGKKFNAKAAMENHRLVHSGVRNHMCSQCGWEFMRRSDLIRHLKKVDHSKPVKNVGDRRKFECEMCGMAFYRMADKSNHVKSTHGESPYAFK
ncbi:hypothetical protein PMAYCL1PPCAC_02286, partial [Pristionchus mayeri]